MAVLVAILIVVLMLLVDKNDSLKHELRRKRGLGDRTEFGNPSGIWFEDFEEPPHLHDDIEEPPHLHDDIEDAAPRPLSEDDKLELRRLRREDAKRHAEQAEGEDARRKWEEILKEIGDD